MSISLERLRDDLNAVTGQVSTLVRSTVLGILAMVWLFLAGKDAPTWQALAAMQNQFLVIAAVCVTALACDLVQYLVAYYYLNAIAEKAKRNRLAVVSYPEQPSRDFRFVFFYAKIMAAVVASVWFVVLIFAAVAS